jgi:lysylphosphatidylglycerol synthetase-like protein (DUF2156 family)
MESRREALVRAFGHGDLIAASTLQTGLHTFETSFGAVVFARALGTAITLGGPLCAETDRKEIVTRFLGRERRTTFFYVRRDLLPSLEGHGLSGAGIGVDRHADTVSLMAAPPREVKSAIRGAEKAGLGLREATGDLGALWPKLAAIHAGYLARAEVPVEMAFLNRPMVFGHAPLRRIFLLEERGELLGFAVLNPIFTSGRVTAWLLDILRFGPTRVWGVWLFCVARLAAMLAQEGVGLSLGFCPFSEHQHPEALPSPRLRRHVDSMVRWLSSAPYLRRLRRMKAIIPGTDEPRYLASFTSFGAVPLLAFLRASGLGPRVFLGPDLVRVLARGARAGRTPGAGRPAEVRV